MLSSTPDGRRLLLVLTAVLACGPTSVITAQEIRIGLIAPLSGGLVELGDSCREGALLAVTEANRDGGLLVAGKRRPVALRMKDSQGRPELAVSVAEELINQDQVAAIIGPPTSGSAVPVARLAERAGIPMITQVATSPEVTRGTTCVFRTCFTDSVQSVAMARFAWNELRARVAAILFDVANDYPRSIADLFSAEFRRLGGRVILESYTTGLTDFRTQVSRVRAAKADVILLPNYVADLRRQLDQLREAGGGIMVIGTDTMGFREQADIDRIDHAYFSTHFSPDMPAEAVRSFVSAYRAAYNRVPTAPSGALTYDAIRLLFDVIRKQGSTTPAAICAGLRGVGRFEGVTGVMDFNGSADPRKNVIIVKTEGGKLSYAMQMDIR
jgi:branched-chain amino acid transport system substrate-binding protein